MTCRSLAIVGLEKNTGKTECLNYILHRLQSEKKKVALTSVGLDGENRDQVCRSPKPEIEVYEGMVFMTSERHFREKRLTAEVLSLSDRRTALGRLVTARAVLPGKVLLSGPPDTAGLKQWVEEMREKGVDLVLVDGALSRLSHGSPAVCEAMVLATGAAVSGNIPQLVRKTRYVYDLIGLQQAKELPEEVYTAETGGIRAIGEGNKLYDLGIPSALTWNGGRQDLFRYGRRLYVAGVVGDKLLEWLRIQKEPVELVIRDFTRMFASPETFYAFLNKGGKIEVVRQSRLLAVCVNPQSPAGFCLDSVRLCEALEESLGVAVYDVKKM